MARRSLVKTLFDAVVLLAAVLLLAFVFRVLLPPEQMAEGPVKVVDGDSLRRGATDIRLYGIDAPEYRQACKDGQDHDYACGKEAAGVLRKLVGGRDVACKAMDTDRYGRQVSLCTAGSTPLNEEMVKQGWAVAYRSHSLRFVGLETQARAAHRGLWQGRFELPEDYRHRSRDPVRGDMASAGAAEDD